MGVGLPQAMAACAVYEGRRPVVAVMGDSAFGFSGMEFEVVCRYQMPIVVVILNNNGIGSFNPESYYEQHSTQGDMQTRLRHPGKALSPRAHYEQLATAFGGDGYFVETAEQLELAVQTAFSGETWRPAIINCMIATDVVGKPKTNEAPPFAPPAKL